MPAPRYQSPAELLRGLSKNLRGAVAAAADLDPAVLAMSPAELDAAYAELDRLRASVMGAIEQVMLRRRAVEAADRVQGALDLRDLTPEQRAEARELLEEHAEMLASLR